ncbi:hypothetical protein JCM8547_007716 [Rhodosporidiobolus lusitaniae]
MALFGTLRRLRSRTNLSNPSSPNPPPSSSSADSPKPPAPFRTSAQTIPVPQASLRLRGDVGKIGYLALGDPSSREGETDESRSEEMSGDEKLGGLEFASEPYSDSQPGTLRRKSKRWSSPAAAPSLSTIFLPSPEAPSLPISPPPPATHPHPYSDSPMSPVTAREAYAQAAKRHASNASLGSTTSPSTPSSPSRSRQHSSSSLFTTSPSTSSLSLNHTISTRVDANGRRVLTSRRRAGSTDIASPPTCKRNQGAFGVGDDEESLWEAEESMLGHGIGEEGEVEKAGGWGVEDFLVRPLSVPEPMGIGLGLVQGGMEGVEPATSMETLQLPESTPKAQPGFSSSSSSQPSTPRRPRPPLAPLQPVPPVDGLSSSSPTQTRRPLPTHQPIQPLYPPPPLYPPSPSKSSTLLSRAYSAYSSSTSSSAGAKRRNSLQPRRTLTKRLSVSGMRSGSSSPAKRGNASFGPPMSTSVAPSHAGLSSHTPPSTLVSRRFSAPVQPLTPLHFHLLQRNSSLSTASACHTPSSPTFSSIPPTPSSLSHASEGLLPMSSLSSHGHSSGYGGGGGYEHLSSTSASEHSHLPPSATSVNAPPSQTRRASVVSFELPPSPTLSRRRTQVSNHNPPPHAPSTGMASASGGRSWQAGHRRSASDGEVLLRGGRGGAGGMGGEEGGGGSGSKERRERITSRSGMVLFIANPDPLPLRSPPPPLPTLRASPPPFPLMAYETTSQQIGLAC